MGKRFVLLSYQLTKVQLAGVTEKLNGVTNGGWRKLGLIA